MPFVCHPVPSRSIQSVRARPSPVLAVPLRDAYRSIGTSGAAGRGRASVGTSDAIVREWRTAVTFRANLTAVRIALALLATLCAVSASASSRLEIVDGNLWDHDSGLIWQPLENTRGFRLPVDAIVGEWRVATGNELFALMGHPADEVIARDSDPFFAMSFFAAGKPCPTVGYEGCFGGWWHDLPARTTDPAFYNVGGYTWTAIDGDPNHVFATSGFSLGSYTEERCGPFCSNDKMLYTVRPIPEPGTGILIWTGLVVASLCRRGRSGMGP